MDHERAERTKERGRGRALDVALRSVAALVLVLALATSVHDLSQAWDVGYYHLPFAGRLAGLLSPATFVFHPANVARFEGFPLLGERIQGLLWRVTGRPEAVNLLSFSAVPVVAWFLRVRFAVPWPLTVLGLFAIPLVQTHATSGYVDLPANAAATVLILLVVEAFTRRGLLPTEVVPLALVAAAVAANMKALLHPIVGVALMALALRLLTARPRVWSSLAVLVVALPIVFATPLANLARHGNPYYPVRLTIAGHVFPGPEEAYDSSPPWLARAPRPVRFACSLAEARVRPFTEERRWTVDQWMPDETGGNRMGGFFNLYVLANLALLGWRLWSERAREVKIAGAGVAITTLVIALMPQSHELRYYMCWMLVLVATNLWLACRPEARGPALRLLGFACLLAMVIVVASTRGAYLTPTGSRLEDLLAAKVDAKAFEGIGDGATVCIERAPWNVLWAPELHAPKRYTVVEAETPADCGAARLVE